MVKTTNGIAIMKVYSRCCRLLLLRLLLLLQHRNANLYLYDDNLYSWHYSRYYSDQCGYRCDETDACIASITCAATNDARNKTHGQLMMTRACILVMVTASQVLMPQDDDYDCNIYHVASTIIMHVELQ
jgi:hypothetical protein